MGIVYRCDKCLQLLPDKGASIILTSNDKDLEYDVCNTCFKELSALFIHDVPQSPIQEQAAPQNEPEQATQDTAAVDQQPESPTEQSV